MKLRELIIHGIEFISTTNVIPDLLKSALNTNLPILCGVSSEQDVEVLFNFLIVYLNQNPTFSPTNLQYLVKIKVYPISSIELKDFVKIYNVIRQFEDRMEHLIKTNFKFEVIIAGGVQHISETDLRYFKNYRATGCSLGVDIRKELSIENNLKQLFVRTNEKLEMLDAIF